MHLLSRRTLLSSHSGQYIHEQLLDLLRINRPQHVTRGCCTGEGATRRRRGCVATRHCANVSILLWAAALSLLPIWRAGRRSAGVLKNTSSLGLFGCQSIAAWLDRPSMLRASRTPSGQRSGLIYYAIVHLGLVLVA